MKFVTYDYRIAEYYLSALINGDESGMIDKESAEFDAWQKRACKAATDAGYSIGHWADIEGSGEDWGCCEVSNLFAMRCTVRLHVYREKSCVKRYGTMLRIFDNARSFDRYTIVPPRWAKDYRENQPGLWSAIGASEHPQHPQGFGQGTTAIVGKHLGKRIAWGALSADVQRFARQSFPEFAP